MIDSRNIKIKTRMLAPELLRRMDAYWDIANHLSVGRIYLYDKTVCSVLGFCMAS